MFYKKELLTPEVKAKISEVIKDAEKKTSAEIVVYIVKSSGNYLEAIFKSAFIFNFLGLIIANLMDLYNSPIFSYLLFNFEFSEAFLRILLVIFFTVVGSLLCQIPFYKKLFILKNDIEEKVNERAKLAFLEKEVFNTKQRTGILIFISFFERRVVVLGDSGINQKVRPDAWKEVVRLIIEGIKKNDLALGIKEAVIYCGELLAKSGLVISRDDTNELSNEITEKEN